MLRAFQNVNYRDLKQTLFILITKYHVNILQQVGAEVEQSFHLLKVVGLNPAAIIGICEIKMLKSVFKL